MFPFMMPVAVIGARRARQGIGEHVARYLARHGAEVRAIVGTSPASVAEAQAGLARHGVRCAGYTSFDALLEAERGIEAVAICSPIPAHAAALEMAAGRGLHVLCDKPLAFDPERDLGAFVRAQVERIAAAGRFVDTITQWPKTLSGFRRLYPESNGKAPAPRRFEMLLSPTTQGLDMLVDSLPHPLSMLRALCGPGAVRPGAIEWSSDERAQVRFAYAPASGAPAVDVAVRLARCASQPRPASYAIDGRHVDREVRMPGYTMELVAPDGRRTAIEDPLEEQVKEFLGRAKRGDRPDVEALVGDVAAMQSLVRSSSSEVNAS